MTVDNSITKPVRNKNKPTKPAKPYPDFPLYAHASGQWSKKIRGDFYYFGKWDDPDAALAKYLDQKDALYAGKEPRPDPNALEVKGVANLFLEQRQELVDAGELAPRTYADYKSIMDMMVDGLGKHTRVTNLSPADFSKLRNKLTKTNGPHRLGTIIQVIRCAFKHAYDSEMLDRPIRFGPGFKRPSKKTLRLHRAKQGPKFFTADEVHSLLGKAGVTMRAMILLGVNAGYGNADCGKLKIGNLDLDKGWATFPRPKTGVDRRCPLWPETIQAIKDAMKSKPEPKDKADSELVFLTKYGTGWDKEEYAGPITHEMTKIMGAVGVNGHRNFYALRHTFRTVADSTKDLTAIRFIMGHTDNSIDAQYTELIEDSRLRVVTDHVHTWLFGAEKGGAV